MSTSLIVPLQQAMLARLCKRPSQDTIQKENTEFELLMADLHEHMSNCASAASHACQIVQ